MKRTLTLDLDRFAERFDAHEEIGNEDVKRAERGREWVGTVLGLPGYPAASIELIVDADVQDFDAAHEVVDGSGNPANRMAAEQIEPSAYNRIESRFENLTGVPDPGEPLGEEFV